MYLITQWQLTIWNWWVWAFYNFELMKVWVYYEISVFEKNSRDEVGYELWCECEYFITTHLNIFKSVLFFLISNWWCIIKPTYRKGCRDKYNQKNEKILHCQSEFSLGNSTSAIWFLIRFSFYTLMQQRSWLLKFLKHFSRLASNWLLLPSCK